MQKGSRVRKAEAQTSLIMAIIDTESSTHRQSFLHASTLLSLCPRRVHFPLQFR